MTPAARVQAAIELLDAIIVAARDAGAAADTLIARYFKDRRYAGSKDRRAIRDLIYEVIRFAGERPASGRAALIGYAREHAPELLALFGTGAHAPAALMADEPAAQPSLAPRWLVERLSQQFGEETEAELRALLERAPLDLRVNRLKADRYTVAAMLPGTVPTPRSPMGLRASESLNIEAHPAFTQGLVEVQDEGSQLAVLACDAQPGMTVVDLCAGAGGKTLPLAASMVNRGRLIACDTDRNRLARLGPRAERAGASIIETRLLDAGREASQLEDLAGTADLVLVDAPCSGTGTWRRNPEARWRLTPARLDRLRVLQTRVLEVGARLVRPGGRLVYVVCSLLREEGEAQIVAFLERYPDWRPSDFLLPTSDKATASVLLTPYRHATDGFYIAAVAPI